MRGTVPAAAKGKDDDCDPDQSQQDGKSIAGRTTVQQPVRQPGYDALAAAHSDAVDRLSQDIAGAIKMLGGGIR